MSSHSSVLAQSATAAVPSPHLAIPSTSPSTAPTPSSGPRDEPQLTRPSQDSVRSVYCDAVQNQHDSDSDTKTQPSHSSTSKSAVSATNPATTAPDDVWNYSEPVPGSKKKKLIFYRAPFEWGQWTRQEWLERFIFVKDKLEALVYEHLRLVDFTNRPVYSARMVGTSPSEARPAVVVTCRDADFRAIRNLFQARAEKPLGLGRMPAASQIRASFGRRGRRPASPILRLQLVYYRTPTPPVTRDALEKPLAVSLGAGGAACGGITRYGERSATLGVALDVGGKLRILTVDHLFSSRETHSRSSALNRDSTSLNPLSLPVPADSDETDSDRLWEDDDEYEDLASPNDESLGLQQLDSNIADTTRVFGPEDSEGEPAEWEWKLWSSSPDPASSAIPYLDWALTYPESTTPEASDICLNTVFPTGNGNGNEGVILREIEKAPEYQLAPVYMVSGIRGFLRGQILQAPSFLPANNTDQGSCEVWTVILNEPGGRVLSGESGSVVVDSTSNKVYGHVVGSDALGHAYVVPLAQLLGQLSDFHDCNVELATSTRLRASSENPASKFRLQTTAELSGAMGTETVSEMRAQASGKQPDSWDALTVVDSPRYTPEILGMENNVLQAAPSHSHNSMEAFLNEAEKRFVLAEIIKVSQLDVGVLVDFIKSHRVQPDWMHMQLPGGCNLTQCIHAIETMFQESMYPLTIPSLKRALPNDLPGHVSKRQAIGSPGDMSPAAIAPRPYTPYPQPYAFASPSPTLFGSPALYNPVTAGAYNPATTGRRRGRPPKSSQGTLQVTTYPQITPPSRALSPVPHSPVSVGPQTDAQQQPARRPIPPLLPLPPEPVPFFRRPNLKLEGRVQPDTESGPGHGLPTVEPAVRSTDTEAEGGRFSEP